MYSRGSCMAAGSREDSEEGIKEACILSTTQAIS